MALTTGQLMLIEQRVTNDGPSSGAAWLLYLFMGYFGIHRFYLRRPVSGILMLVTAGGFLVWWFIDLFLLSGMIRQRRDELRRDYMVDMMATGGGGAAEAAAA